MALPSSRVAFTYGSADVISGITRRAAMPVQHTRSSSVSSFVTMIFQVTLVEASGLFPADALEGVGPERSARSFFGLTCACGETGAVAPPQERVNATRKRATGPRTMPTILFDWMLRRKQ